MATALSQQKRLILCLNAGSSTVKFALFAPSLDGAKEVVQGAVERIGLANAHAWIRVRASESSHQAMADERRIHRAVAVYDHHEAMNVAFSLLQEVKISNVMCVVHRVVHGGGRYNEPIRVDQQCVDMLKTFVSLAPGHMPAALSGIEGAQRYFADAVQIACFDSAFHATLPELATHLPFSPALHEKGLRRYGFHGLSYESVLAARGANLSCRMIVAHLGSGSSLVALRDGRSCETTMGFSPFGGVMMATRAGDVDPGVLFYLHREYGMTMEELENMVARESGLKAIAGTSDMQEVLQRVKQDRSAQLGLDLYCYGVKKAIGALSAVLGGMDELIFTGGVGEHAAEIRRRCCEGLDYLGIEIDEILNHAHQAVISTANAACVVRIVACDENRMMVAHAMRLLAED